MERHSRHHGGSRVMVLLNLGLFIALGVNVASRASESRNWWGPSGCPQPREYSYAAISYGDTIQASDLSIWVDLMDLSANRSAATNIIMAPFFGQSSINNVAQHVTQIHQAAINGVEIAIVLYKPFNISVPERAWRYANKWVQQADYRVILDRTGDVVTDIEFEPCECLYAVVLDQHNIVKWAGDARLTEAAFWNLIFEVAQGNR